MNAPISKPFESSEYIDDRLAFLLLASVHHQLVESQCESIDRGFATVVRTFDDMFPPNDQECATCGLKPCGNPSFCAACRRADERLRARARSRSAR